MKHLDSVKYAQPTKFTKMDNVFVPKINHSLTQKTLAYHVFYPTFSTIPPKTVSLVFNMSILMKLWEDVFAALLASLSTQNYWSAFAHRIALTWTQLESVLAVIRPQYGTMKQKFVLLVAEDKSWILSPWSAHAHKRVLIGTERTVEIAHKICQFGMERHVWLAPTELILIQAQKHVQFVPQVWLMFPRIESVR